MGFNCQICGKPKAVGNHRKCSRELQRMYAPGTALHAERQKDKAGRLASRVVLPARRVDIVGGQSGFFSRCRKGEE